MVLPAIFISRNGSHKGGDEETVNRIETSHMNNFAERLGLNMRDGQKIQLQFYKRNQDYHASWHDRHQE